MTLSEKLQEAQRLASVIPNRLCDSRVLLEVRGDGFVASYAGVTEGRGTTPDAAVDELIAELRPKVDAYLANLEEGIASQMKTVREARAALQPAVFVRADASELPASSAV